MACYRRLPGPSTDHNYFLVRDMKILCEARLKHDAEPLGENEKGSLLPLEAEIPFAKKSRKAKLNTDRAYLRYIDLTPPHVVGSVATAQPVIDTVRSLTSSQWPGPFGPSTHAAPG